MVVDFLARHAILWISEGSGWASQSRMCSLVSSAFCRSSSALRSLSSCFCCASALSVEINFFFVVVLMALVVESIARTTSLLSIASPLSMAAAKLLRAIIARSTSSCFKGHASLWNTSLIFRPDCALTSFARSSSSSLEHIRRDAELPFKTSCKNFKRLSPLGFPTSFASIPCKW